MIWHLKLCGMFAVWGFALGMILTGHFVLGLVGIAGGTALAVRT